MCFEPALLKGHETGGGEEPGFVVREEVVERRDGAAVVVKRQPLVVQVEQRSDDITGLPPNRGWIVDINSNLMHCSYFQKRSTWESLCYVKEDIEILGTCTVSITLSMNDMGHRDIFDINVPQFILPILISMSHSCPKYYL